MCVHVVVLNNTEYFNRFNWKYVDCYLFVNKIKKPWLSM